ncbi:MAG: ECF-type sigma factor [Pseudomonadota bacterium]
MQKGTVSAINSAPPGTLSDETVDRITHIVQRHSDGDASAFDQAIELLYGELRRIAHRNRRQMGGNPTLHTTALVNEAYLKMKSASGDVTNAAHFLAIASRAVRQIIVDYARSRRAAKRGGGAVHVELDPHHTAVDAEVEQLLIVEEATARLAAHNERLAKIFELKFYAGLSDEELALAVPCSKRTAQRDWMKARAFISDYMTSEDSA